MKLAYPIDNFVWKRNISQLFAVNKNWYRTRLGMPYGHNGIDIAFPDSPNNGYGQKVRAAHSGKIVKIFSDFPTKTYGTGIYLQQKTNTGFLETIYWHLSDVTIKVGDEVNVWDVIGLVGNTGLVTPRPSKNCPYCGSHLHFGVRLYNSLGQLIQTDLNGFVDPTPLLYNKGDKLPISFKRDLYLGKGGDETSWLQTILAIEGFAEDYEPIGFYGYKTLRDVRLLQKRYLIKPSYGFVGSKTRLFLNTTYT